MNDNDRDFSLDTLYELLLAALNPAFIMAMVGSLVFFLLQLTYGGQFEARIHYVFALFVFASVLIARIAIEEGNEHALPFGLALAVAVGLVLWRFELNLLVAIVFVGLVWWCAHRLTWDCTVLEHDPEGPGQGIFTSLGWDTPVLDKHATTQLDPPSEVDREPATGRSVSRWWRWAIGQDQRPHAPGASVLLFALAALPLFGVGSLFLNANSNSRTTAFFLFCIYLASGLGLLVTTSLLSLRRYLRKRHLDLTPQTSVAWLASGLLLIVGLLVVTAIFPRPGAEISLSRPPYWPQLAGRSTPSATSPWAIGEEGWHDPTNADRIGTSPPDTDPDNPQEIQPEQNGSQQNGSQQNGSQQNGPQRDRSRRDQAKPGETGSSSSRSRSEPVSGGETRAAARSWQRPQLSATELLRWIVHLAFWAGALWVGWRSRELVWNALLDLWNGLRGWWGFRDGANRASESVEEIVPPRRFSDFTNPFLGGTRSPAAIVRTTIDALEAWSAERGWPRRADQTLDEFARQLATYRPKLRDELHHLVQLHAQLAYAGQPIKAAQVQPLQRLWTRLGRPD